LSLRTLYYSDRLSRCQVKNYRYALYKFINRQSENN